MLVEPEVTMIRILVPALLVICVLALASRRSEPLVEFGQAVRVLGCEIRVELRVRRVPSAHTVVAIRPGERALADSVAGRSP